MEENEKAYQLIVDCYGCDEKIINSLEEIKKAVHEGCRAIGTTIVEECYHRFEPVGISAMAVITTSHFSIHTWPENGYAAIDVFSCSKEVPDKTAENLGKLVGAEKMKIRRIERQIK